MENNLNKKYKKLQEYIDYKNVTAFKGRFGIGKTTFIDNFIEKTNDKNLFIKFNANDFDYVKNPRPFFIQSVILEIIKLLPKEEVKKYGKLMGKNLLNIVSNKAKEFVDWSSDDFVKKALAEDLSIKSQLNEVRRLLKEMIEVSTITKNIVLLIDDLDRARPNFALDVFEIAKHLFDVDNLSVILVYNPATIQAISEQRYGSVEGEEYVRKYVDNDFNFHELNFLEIADILNESNELNLIQTTKDYYYVMMLAYYMDKNGKSMREVKKAFESNPLSAHVEREINNLNNTKRDRQDFFAFFLGGLLYFYLFNSAALKYEVNYKGTGEQPTIKYSKEMDELFEFILEAKHEMFNSVEEGSMSAITQSSMFFASDQIIRMIEKLSY